MAKIKPLKKLLTPKKSNAGRSHGKITVRHRGGGHKRKYRLVDFQRLDMLGISAKVESLEYDPNRSCLVAKILYANGKRSYILAPDKLKCGG